MTPYEFDKISRELRNLSRKYSVKLNKVSKKEKNKILSNKTSLMDTVRKSDAFDKLHINLKTKMSKLTNYELVKFIEKFRDVALTTKKFEGAYDIAKNTLCDIVVSRIISDESSSVVSIEHDALVDAERLDHTQSERELHTLLMGMTIDQLEELGNSIKNNKDPNHLLKSNIKLDPNKLKELEEVYEEVKIAKEIDIVETASVEEVSEELSEAIEEHQENILNNNEQYSDLHAQNQTEPKIAEVTESFGTNENDNNYYYSPDHYMEEARTTYGPDIYSGQGLESFNPNPDSYTFSESEIYYDTNENYTESFTSSEGNEHDETEMENDDVMEMVMSRKDGNY